MPFFHFLQFEHKLFCYYFKRLRTFLAECGHCAGKWEMWESINEGVNGKTWIPLEYKDFCGQSADEARCLFQWIGWDSFEFEKASNVSRYSFSDVCLFYHLSVWSHLRGVWDPCLFYARSYYAPFFCDLCNSFGYKISSCLFYTCYAQPGSSLPLIQCAGFEAREPSSTFCLSISLLFSSLFSF